MDKALFISTNLVAGVAASAAAKGDNDADQNLVAVLLWAAWIEAAVNEVIHELASRNQADLDTEFHDAYSGHREHLDRDRDHSDR